MLTYKSFDCGSLYHSKRFSYLGKDIRMEHSSGQETFRVDEWTIENFSFWNKEIHGEVIRTSKSFIDPDFTIELYPRSEIGYGEYIRVRLHSSKPITFKGDLSFIDSDGSILCMQQVDSLYSVESTCVSFKLKFEDVITRVTKNNALYKDRLTLRYRLRRNKDTKVYRRTVIDVFDISFRISPKSFDNLGIAGKGISLIQYPCDKEEIGQMILDVSKNEVSYSKMCLTLKPDPFRRNILVFTYMSILNKDEDIIRTEENDHIFRDENKWTFSNSITEPEVVNDNFSMILHLKIIPSNKYKHYFGHFQINPEVIALLPTDSFTNPSTSSSEKHFLKSKTSETSNQPIDSVTVLTKELMCLFQDQDFSDFRLKCGDVTFPVHKNILSARSPVFKTMLSCDMKEAASGEVVIEDLDPSTFALFLSFLYTGIVEDLESDRALKLYYAADKYQVPSLKNECAEFLSVNVCISNVCDILSFANRHQDDKLNEVAQGFFLDNYNEVLGSEEWKTFMKSEPLLAVETVTHFGEKKFVRKSGATKEFLGI